MKRNILHLILLLLALGANAQAQTWCCPDEAGFYARVLNGANFLANTTADGNRAQYQTGYTVSTSLGYCGYCGLCLEAEYAYRRNGIKDINFFVEGSSNNGHFQTSSYMANLLWDVPLPLWACDCWNVQPFVGAGIGYDVQQMHSSNSRIIFNQKWHHFSWQLMIGLAHPFWCDTEVTLEYKFHQGGSQFNNNSIGVGLIYNFGCFR